MMFGNLTASDWEIKNKWKISCGIVKDGSLIVDGVSMEKFVSGTNILQNHGEFNLNNVIFNLDHGDVGSCPTDKKYSGGYPYSGRQEINQQLPYGDTVFETEIIIEGAPSYRSTFFQIHDGRNSGAPPSWIGVGKYWEIKHSYPKNECSVENCKTIKNLFLVPGKKYILKAEINYQKNYQILSVKYYLNDEFIVQHLNVPISSKINDGPYGQNKPYIKIGIYRIGEIGTTSYIYNNVIMQNKLK